MEQTKFSPFDGFDKDEFRYSLKRTTNKNVKAIYEVFTRFSMLNQSTRIGFARKAGIKPELIESPIINKETGENEGSERIEKWYFDNSFNSPELFYCALAYEIFEGFPKLYRIDSDGVAVEIEGKTPGLNDLVLSEVKTAFFLWKNSFELIA